MRQNDAAHSCGRGSKEEMGMTANRTPGAGEGALRSMNVPVIASPLLAMSVPGNTSSSQDREFPFVSMVLHHLCVSVCVCVCKSMQT